MKPFTVLFVVHLQLEFTKLNRLWFFQNDP
jgi:hypothetical protein